MAAAKASPYIIIVQVIFSSPLGSLSTFIVILKKKDPRKLVLGRGAGGGGGGAGGDWLVVLGLTAL